MNALVAQPNADVPGLRYPAHAVTGLVGTSFKHEHLPAILADETASGFFEVHAENYMGAGGAPHQALARIRRDHPVSLHGVCMSIGASHPLDKAHLARFKALVDRYEPALVSEHLAWSTHDTTFYNDLLPLPYTATTLAWVAAHINELQDTIDRQILLENPATYVIFPQSTMSEADFLRELVGRTGCGLLLDVNNVFVSATNHGYSALQYLDDFPFQQVGEIHLAGHAAQADDEGDLLLIDSHDGPVADPVWDLFDTFVERCGPIPTLVEWDSQIPDWPVLKAEAAAAKAILDRHAERAAHPAQPAHVRSHQRGSSGGSFRPETFTAGLLRPDYPTPDLVAGPKGKSARMRYNVYRNNVTVSLINALAAIFPATQRITGVDFFRAMARAHVRATPPTSPLLFEYGRDFAGFIEQHDAARSMPWLADVARTERAWLDAYHAADAEPLTPHALESVPAERLPGLVLTPHPATRIVRSPYPAVTIFAANRDDRPAEVDAAGEAEDALLTRPSQDVMVRRLPPGGARFLSRLMAGVPLGDAAIEAIEECPEFDLAANIAGMLGAGAFASVRNPSE